MHRANELQLRTTRNFNNSETRGDALFVCNWFSPLRSKFGDELAWSNANAADKSNFIEYARTNGLRNGYRTAKQTQCTGYIKERFIKR